MNNQKLLKITKALSDPTRLKIIQFILKEEKCVCEIIPHVNRSQPTVSLQLKKLEDLDLIKSTKKGKFVFYSIKEEKIKEILKLFQ